MAQWWIASPLTLARVARWQRDFMFEQEAEWWEDYWDTQFNR